MTRNNEHSQAQPWQQLAAALYQACGAYDMPVRVLDALSAAAHSEPFAHLINGLLPVEPPVQQPVSGADGLPSMLRDGPYRRDGMKTQAFMPAAADEIERLRAAQVQPSGNTQDAEDAARYRWLRDRNDWHAEPRLDEEDGTVWKLTIYTPAPIIDPTDDDSLDNALIAAMLADASGCRPKAPATGKQFLTVQPSGNAGRMSVRALIQETHDNCMYGRNHNGWEMSLVRAGYRAALAAQASERVQDQDADLAHTIDQRDVAEGWADGLAGLIGKYFGQEIGEHSSAHCPWQEAKDIIEEGLAAQASGQEQLDRNAVIEECARIADRTPAVAMTTKDIWRHVEAAADEIAAAIRALKSGDACAAAKEGQ